MPAVLHIGKYFPPERGGIESATAMAVDSALREGHDVQVLCFSSATEGGVAGVLHTEGRNAAIHRMPGRVISSQPLGLRYVFKGLALARQADLVHLHFPNMLAALMAMFIPRRTRLLVHWHSDVVGKGLLGTAFRVFEELMLRRADAVVCTSLSYASSSVPLRRFQSKVRVAPLGVRDPRPQPQSRALDAKVSQWLGGRQLILSVGRLVPYKGFDTLITAASHLPDTAAVVIVGDGPQRQALTELIHHRELGHKVFLAGGVEQDVLYGLFEAADLFALASNARSEAFGVVLAEAMAFGLPVVACDIPGSGVPWVNQHGKTGMNVPVGDADLLADACARILSDDGLMAVLSAQARRRYDEHFSEVVSGRALMKVYRDLLRNTDGACAGTM